MFPRIAKSAQLRRPAPRLRKMFAPGDVHYNSVLTNFAVGYMQSSDLFVARRVLTQVPVMKQADVYYIWNRAEENRDDFEKRAPGTEAPVIRKTKSTDTYFADRWSLAYDIDDDERRNADPVFQNLENQATESLMFKGMLRQEIEFAETFMIPGPWTHGVAGAGAVATGAVKYWSDSTSDPIGDVKSAATIIQLASGGFRPNVLVLGQQVADKVSEHPDFVDRVKYGGSNGSPAVINRAAMAALFGVEQVEIMGAVKNAAAAGLPEANQFIGGKSALLAYRTAAASNSTPTFGSQFNWTPGGVGVEGVQVKTFRMDPIDADRVEGNMWFSQKLTAADLGYFFDGIVA